MLSILLLPCLTSERLQQIYTSILFVFHVFRTYLHAQPIIIFRCSNNTVPCYVIYILAAYPACRNLLHVTVLTIPVDLNKSCSFCLCSTSLATYAAQCNLLHFTKFRSILIMPSQFVGLLNVFLLQVFELTFYVDLSFSPCYFLNICLCSS